MYEGVFSSTFLVYLAWSPWLCLTVPFSASPVSLVALVLTPLALPVSDRSPVYLSLLFLFTREKQK